MLHETQQRDGLQCLSQTHFISQDSIDVVLMQSNHPVETPDLVVPHCSSLDVSWTLVKLDHIGLGCVQIRQQLLIFLLENTFVVIPVSCEQCLC